jgi:hypothetical protein
MSVIHVRVGCQGLSNIDQRPFTVHNAWTWHIIKASMRMSAEAYAAASIDEISNRRETENALSKEIASQLVPGIAVKFSRRCRSGMVLQVERALLHTHSVPIHGTNNN